MPRLRSWSRRRQPNGAEEFLHSAPAQVQGAGGRSPQLGRAVIVSNDGANGTAARLKRGVVTIVPLTSNVERVHPFQVLLASAATGLDRDSKAQAEQVRPISVERLGARVGAVPGAEMLEIDEALRVHLAL